ncbi:hypothetical protein GGQ19_003268, partial [Salinibacter ruber]|nr:hypothetical protein [Salinibacter ruber]MCS3752067.1 hypothetical protein [Salinibacter ruber]
GIIEDPFEADEACLFLFKCTTQYKGGV